jgi:hypothetical protein
MGIREAGLLRLTRNGWVESLRYTERKYWRRLGFECGVERYTAGSGWGRHVGIGTLRTTQYVDPPWDGYLHGFIVVGFGYGAFVAVTSYSRVGRFLSQRFDPPRRYRNAG